MPWTSADRPSTTCATSWTRSCTWTARASSGATPHWNTVYGYFVKCQQEGVFTQINGLLRQLLRQKEGKDPEPSACVIDAQSTKPSTNVHARGQGVDAVTWACPPIGARPASLVLVGGRRQECLGKADVVGEADIGTAMRGIRTSDRPEGDLPTVGSTSALSWLDRSSI